jgi:hypothetical protein
MGDYLIMITLYISGFLKTQMGPIYILFLHVAYAYIYICS